MRFFPVVLFGVLSLAASVVGAEESASANEAAPNPLDAQIEHVVKHIGELQAIQLVDDRCQWLDSTSRFALNITVDERRAWLAEKSPDTAA